MRGLPPPPLFLRNEANHSERREAWIILVHNMLSTQVRQIVTWLRLSKIGFVRTILGFVFAMSGRTGLDFERKEANLRPGTAILY